MYAAEVIEQAPAELVATAPAHPYTLGLLRSFPDMHSARRALRGIPGTPPDLRNDFPCCSFEPHCEFRFQPCRTAHPALREPAARAVAAPQAAAATARAEGPQVSDWRVACHQHDPRYQPHGPRAGLNGLPAVDVMRTETQVGAERGGGDT